MSHRDAHGRFRPVCPVCQDSGTVDVCWNNDPNRCETIVCDREDCAAAAAYIAAHAQRPDDSSYDADCP